jgi:hypothetical protein
MSPAPVPVPVVVWEFHSRKLARLQALATSDEVVCGRADAALVIAAVGALSRLHQLHRVDEHGRCTMCRRPLRRWWPPRHTRPVCGVHAALAQFLPQPHNTGYEVST